MVNRRRKHLYGVLAVLTMSAGFVGAGTALAGTYGPAGCNIPPNQGCRTPNLHTYDDAGGYVPNCGNCAVRVIQGTFHY